MKLIYFLILSVALISCAKAIHCEDYDDAEKHDPIEAEDLDLYTDSVYSVTDWVVVED